MLERIADLCRLLKRDLPGEGIVERLNQVEASELTEITFAEYDEQYQWFLGIAIVLLVAEALVLGRRNPLLRGVKLFERDAE